MSKKKKKPSIQQQLMDTVKIPMEWIEAPAWKRIVAFIFDMFLIAPISNFLFPINPWLSPVFVAVYYVALETSPWKGSVGKRIMSMKVIDDKKKTVTIDRLIVRYFAKILSLVLFGGGYWLPMLTGKRPIPDQLSHTMIIALTPVKTK